MYCIESDLKQMLKSYIKVVKSTRMYHYEGHYTTHLYLVKLNNDT